MDITNRYISNQISQSTVDRGKSNNELRDLVNSEPTTETQDSQNIETGPDLEGVSDGQGDDLIQEIDQDATEVEFDNQESQIELQVNPTAAQPKVEFDPVGISFGQALPF